MLNKSQEAKRFVSLNPSFAQIRSLFADFDETRDQIKRIVETKDVEPFRYETTELKSTLNEIVRQIELTFGKQIRLEYRKKFLSLNDFLKKNESRLNRPLRDLDDVRFLIQTFDTLKENFVSIDFTIDPLEDVYNLLKKYSIEIPPEEHSAIELLRSTHDRIIRRVQQVTNELVENEPKFLQRFRLDLNQFDVDLRTFIDDYESNGPMIEGLSAREANERLILFEQRFDELWKRYETNVAGEILFGFQQTEYRQLETIKKQFNYFKRLYSLYNSVIQTMNQYDETNWKEIRIDQINNEIQEFQSSTKRRKKKKNHFFFSFR